MELTPIRTGRKITGYTYRGVSVIRKDNDGTTLWAWGLVRYLDGAQLREVKTKNEITAQIDKTLDSKGRDYYAKPVIYVAHNGLLVDARLIEAN